MPREATFDVRFPIQQLHKSENSLCLLLSYTILIKYRILEYVTANGRNQFGQWLTSLPQQVAARIQARLYAVELGHLGDYKGVGSGVFELRIHTGPGYRIYFGRDESVVIVLLGGGTKSSQQRDIARAKKHWSDFKGVTHASKKR
jgi:putative addiction module killer protein